MLQDLMPKSSIQQAAAVIFLALLLAWVAGCARRETDVERGNREGILHLGAGGEPRDLDPTTNIGSSESRIIATLFEGLVVPSADGKKFLPGSAERWDISLDGRVYTFHLRPGLKWSNGDPLTADDFLYGFRRVLEPAVGAEAAQQAFIISGARDFVEGHNKDPKSIGLRVLDPLTFEITLDNPAPYFLGQLCFYPFYPLHRPTLEKFDGYLRRNSGWTRPGNLVGNGAFRLKSWRANESVTVEKNPAYWDADRIRLREVVFHSIDNPDAEELAFRGGRLHATFLLNATKTESYRLAKSPYLHTEPELRSIWLTFNVMEPPFNDVRIRRALALAVDREALAQKVLRGQRPAGNIVVPGAGGYVGTANLVRDPERARALLAEAGFPGGAGFPLVTLTYTASRAGWKEACEALQFMWQKELGIHVELAQIEYKVWLDALRTRKHQFIYDGWGSFVDDPVEWIGLFASLSPNNDAGWVNPEYDAHVTGAERAASPEERFDHFRAAEAILLDQMPILPLYHFNRNYLLQTSVLGWEDNLLDVHPLKDVWLDPKPTARPLGMTTTR
jgi:oligopeptide transport system substrate-binding protein